MTNKLAQARKLLAVTHWRQLRLGRWPCACCGGGLHARLRAADHGVRCLRCGASAITQSLVSVLLDKCPALHACQGLELSGRGALVDWLQPRLGKLARTEYMPQHPAGTSIDGVRNEDVQTMTFPGGQFDLCTSTEVFEHVADDAAGFREIARVLKPGGRCLFTVPFTDADITRERARIDADGHVVHLAEPEYHADPYTGSGKVLAFRNYGRDITARLTANGFAEADIVQPHAAMFGYARPVVHARTAAN